MLILSLRHVVYFQLPFFYGYELLGTSHDISDLLHVIYIYGETGNEIPAGNMQLCELNVALLYSKTWIQEDINMNVLMCVYVCIYVHI